MWHNRAARCVVVEGQLAFEVNLGNRYEPRAQAGVQVNVSGIDLNEILSNKLLKPITLATGELVWMALDACGGRAKQSKSSTRARKPDSL